MARRLIPRVVASRANTYATTSATLSIPTVTMAHYGGISTQWAGVPAGRLHIVVLAYTGGGTGASAPANAGWTRESRYVHGTLIVEVWWRNIQSLPGAVIGAWSWPATAQGVAIQTVWENARLSSQAPAYAVTPFAQVAALTSANTTFVQSPSVVSPFENSVHMTVYASNSSSSYTHPGGDTQIAQTNQGSASASVGHIARVTPNTGATATATASATFTNGIGVGLAIEASEVALVGPGTITTEIGLTRTDVFGQFQSIVQPDLRRIVKEVLLKVVVGSGANPTDIVFGLDNQNDRFRASIDAHRGVILPLDLVLHGQQALLANTGGGFATVQVNYVDVWHPSHSEPTCVLPVAGTPYIVPEGRRFIVKNVTAYTGGGTPIPGTGWGVSIGGGNVVCRQNYTLPAPAMDREETYLVLNAGDSLYVNGPAVWTVNGLLERV